MRLLEGTFTALITPFKNDKLDVEGLEKLIWRQMQAGIQGLILMGSTGEGSVLDEEEQRKIIETAVRLVKGKMVLVAATGTNCTKKTIEKTKMAKDLGADMTLVVTPYYNKPTQEGIYHHFEALTQAVKIPILVYNHPGRCGVNIEVGTMARISLLPGVMGVKDSSGNFNLASEYLHIDPEFILLSGDDPLTLPLIALGAKGVISVASNLIPERMVHLVQAALKGDFVLARKHHYDLLPFFRAEFVETNPIPIKAAMEMCGLPGGSARLPLWKLRPEHKRQLEEVIEALESEQSVASHPK